MTLQFRHIFLTDALTFIRHLVSYPLSAASFSDPGDLLGRIARNAATANRYLGIPIPPPVSCALRSRLSYWCDIRCACTWAMKSMHTTTTISSEVPPK